MKVAVPTPVFASRFSSGVAIHSPRLCALCALSAAGDSGLLQFSQAFYILYSVDKWDYPAFYILHFTFDKWGVRDGTQGNE